MLIVPLQPVPSQQVTVQLGPQTCQIAVYQKNTGMFVDLYVNNALVIGGIIARDLVRIVRSLYLGFSGDLLFVDTEGNEDPFYTGLGSRFSLAYLDASELPAGVG